MIYLIGGPPRCGKTTIARKMSHSWISADTLESIVREHTKKADLDRLFPKNVMRRKTKQGNDLMYSTYTAKEIMRAYIRQSKATWKAIETMVACELSNGHDYVIEGHQLHPKLMHNLMAKFGKSTIRPLILTRLNTDEIVSGGLKHKAKNDWFIQKTKNKETYYMMAEMIRVYSQYYEKEAKKYGMKVVNMDGDFEGKLGEVVDSYKPQ